jgi:hypothetical protein
MRRGVRGLHMVTLPTAAYPASGMMVDLLIGAGCVASRSKHRASRCTNWAPRRASRRR